MSPDTAPERRRRGGFSLIELLVVMVIIAIAASFLLPRFSWLRTPPPERATLETFASQLELARDEAALQGRNLGVHFFRDGYLFLDLDPDTGAWITVEGDDVLADTALDDGQLATLIVEERDIELDFREEWEEDQDTDDADEPPFRVFGQPIPSAGLTPQVVILASGEVTPFTLALESIATDGFARLDGDPWGDLTLSDQRR